MFKSSGVKVLGFKGSGFRGVGHLVRELHGLLFLCAVEALGPRSPTRRRNDRRGTQAQRVGSAAGLSGCGRKERKSASPVGRRSKKIDAAGGLCAVRKGHPKLCTRGASNPRLKKSCERPAERQLYVQRA